MPDSDSFGTLALSKALSSFTTVRNSLQTSNSNRPRRFTPDEAKTVKLLAKTLSDKASSSADVLTSVASTLDIPRIPDMHDNPVMSRYHLLGNPMIYQMVNFLNELSAVASVGFGEIILSEAFSILRDCIDRLKATISELKSKSLEMSLSCDRDISIALVDQIESVVVSLYEIRRILFNFRTFLLEHSGSPSEVRMRCSGEQTSR